jgi:hypothetical protein
MDLTIKYIGNDTGYWRKLKRKFASDYPNFHLYFLTEYVDENFDPRKSFVQTYNENPHIVYIDFSIQEKSCLYFCKLFNRNNTLRLSSLVALHDYGKGWDNINKCLLASVRINHFKSGEVYDVVYDPVCLLNVELAKDPEYMYGKELGIFHLKQILRVGYVEDDLFHIETTSQLPLEHIITVDNNPLDQFMSSKRFFVKSFSDTNLYYNSRFSYDLEFAYGDDDFFKATEESWLLYKKLKDKPIVYKEEKGKRYEDLVADVKARKEKVREIREGVRQWISRNADNIVPKKVKIMVVDNTMQIFSEMQENIGDFKYSINIQNKLTQDFYQIKRTKPHLIVIHYDEINNMKIIQQMVESIKTHANYNPYLLIFNYDAERPVDEYLVYNNVLTYKGAVHIQTIEQMAKKLDEKLHLSETKDRVYFETSSPESIITYTREVKVLTMTESVIYFISEIEIPMWTTFIMEDPTKMLVTVVPHRSSGKFATEKNCYRAMISALGENEKKLLRRTINKSLETED